MGSRSPATIGFLGGLFGGVALSLAITATGGGLTPLLVVPLCGAFVGGSVGMMIPTRKKKH